MVDIELDILQNLNKGKESALKGDLPFVPVHALCAFGTRFVKKRCGGGRYRAGGIYKSMG